MRATICGLLAGVLAGLFGGCASVSEEKREQVERVQQTGIYSYQRIQRRNNAEAVSRHY